jgi:hypothetical protein
VAGFSSFGAHAKAFGLGIALAVLGLGGYLYLGPGAAPDHPPMTVYKSPTCGCCAEWVTHMRDNGFSVTVKSRANVRPVKRQLGVPSGLSSCHTAVVGDYVVEGHVPASEVKRMLANAPSFQGLSVPGMPVGSPGMERGNRVDPYSVIGFTSGGDTTVVAQYGPSR